MLLLVFMVQITWTSGGGFEFPISPSDIFGTPDFVFRMRKKEPGIG